MSWRDRAEPVGDWRERAEPVDGWRERAEPVAPDVDVEQEPDQPSPAPTDPAPDTPEPVPMTPEPEPRDDPFREQVRAGIDRQADAMMASAQAAAQGVEPPPEPGPLPGDDSDDPLAIQFNERRRQIIAESQAAQPSPLPQTPEAGLGRAMGQIAPPDTPEAFEPRERDWGLPDEPTPTVDQMGDQTLARASELGRQRTEQDVQRAVAPDIDPRQAVERMAGEDVSRARQAGREQRPEQASRERDDDTTDSPSMAGRLLRRAPRWMLRLASQAGPVIQTGQAAVEGATERFTEPVPEPDQAQEDVGTRIRNQVQQDVREQYESAGVEPSDEQVEADTDRVMRRWIEDQAREYGISVDVPDPGSISEYRGENRPESLIVPPMYFGIGSRDPVREQYERQRERFEQGEQRSAEELLGLLSERQRELQYEQASEDAGPLQQYLADPTARAVSRVLNLPSNALRTLAEFAERGEEAAGVHVLSDKIQRMAHVLNTRDALSEVELIQEELGEGAAAKIGETLGSAAQYMAVGRGVIPSRVAQGQNLSWIQRTAPTAKVGGVAAIDSFPEMYDSLIEQDGMNPESALVTSSIMAGTSVIDVLPVLRGLQRAERAAGAGLKNRVIDILRNALATGTEESIVNVSGELARQGLREYVFDLPVQDVDVRELVGLSYLMGGFTGATAPLANAIGNDPRRRLEMSEQGIRRELEAIASRIRERTPPEYRERVDQLIEELQRAEPLTPERQQRISELGQQAEQFVVPVDPGEALTVRQRGDAETTEVPTERTPDGVREEQEGQQQQQERVARPDEGRGDGERAQPAAAEPEAGTPEGPQQVTQTEAAEVQPAAVEGEQAPTPPVEAEVRTEVENMTNPQLREELQTAGLFDPQVHRNRAAMVNAVTERRMADAQQEQIPAQPDADVQQRAGAQEGQGQVPAEEGGQGVREGGQAEGEVTVGFHARGDQANPQDTGNVVLAADTSDHASAYGDQVYRVQARDNQVVDADDVVDQAWQAWQTAKDEGSLPPELEAIDFQSREAFSQEFNPPSIIDSAALWDDRDFASWFWNAVGERSGIAVVRTNDGAVVLDPQSVTFTHALPTDAEGTLTRDQLEQRSNRELRDIMRERNIPLPRRRNKQSFIDAIIESERQVQPEPTPETEDVDVTEPDTAAEPTDAPELPPAVGQYVTAEDARTGRDDAAASETPTRPRGARHVEGRRARLVTSDGHEHNVTYHAIEADDLVPSHDARQNFRINPEGDANERPYHDPRQGQGPRETVQRIARQPQTDLLTTDTPTPTDGPPIANTNFVVLGGNARTMAMQLAYHRGGKQAQQIREAMVEASERFGLDRSQVEAMGNPVIVRRIDYAGPSGELSRLLNQSLTTGRTAVVDAVSRANQLSDRTRERIAGWMNPDSGDAPSLREVMADPQRATEIAQMFVEDGAWSQQELDGFMDSDSGRLTDEAKIQIENTLIGSLIDDPSILGQTPAGTRRKILSSLPQLTVASERVDGFQAILKDAVESLPAWRASDLPVRDFYFRQQTLTPPPGFGSHGTASLAQALESLGTRQFASHMREYLQVMGVSQEPALFGPSDPASSAEDGVLQTFGRLFREGQAPDVGQQQGQVVAGMSEDPQAQAPIESEGSVIRTPDGRTPDNDAEALAMSRQQDPAYPWPIHDGEVPAGSQMDHERAKSLTRAETKSELNKFAESIGIENPHLLSRDELENRIAETRTQARQPDPEHDPPAEMHSGVMSRPLMREITSPVSLLAEGGNAGLNEGMVDLVRRLKRSSDDPLIQQAAENGRRAIHDAKAITGELMPTLKPLLRMAGRTPSRKMGRASLRLQQYDLHGNTHHTQSRLYQALEGKIPESDMTAEERQLVKRLRDLIDKTGEIMEREGIQQFNHRTQQYQPFKAGAPVAPRMHTLWFLDAIMQGEGPVFDQLARAIADGNNIDVDTVRETLLKQKRSLQGTDEDSAFRRINAEFTRIWPYMPSHIKHPDTGRTIELLHNHPFTYAQRLVELTSGRVGFVRHFGQEIEPDSMVNRMAERVRDRLGGTKPFIDLTRALHAMPVETTFWTQPGSAMQEWGIRYQYANRMLGSLALSGTWVPNSVEWMGNIQAMAGGFMMKDLWVGLFKSFPGIQRYFATVSTLEELGAINHWVRNMAWNRERPADSVTRILQEVPIVITRAFWRHQEKLAASVALAKSQRMQAGKGTSGDVTDVIAMMELSPEQARAMARGEGTPGQYHELVTRAGAFTTNSPMLSAEMSRLEHRKLFQTGFRFSTYGMMKMRWLGHYLPVYVELARQKQQNPNDPNVHREYMAATLKIARMTAGTTAAGGLTTIMMSTLVGGLLGMSLEWEDAKEDPWDFALDSFATAMFTGPYGHIARALRDRSSSLGDTVTGMIWPVSVSMEAHDAMRGHGRYDEMTPAERVSQFLQRYTSIWRQIQGVGSESMRSAHERDMSVHPAIVETLATFGITKDRNMQTAIRKYWQHRYELAPPPGSRRAGEPAIEELREERRRSAQLRRHMIRAVDAIEAGQDPRTHIQAALELDDVDPASIRRSLYARRLLRGESAEGEPAYEAIRDRMGEEGMKYLHLHDELLESWADYYRGFVDDQPVNVNTSDLEQLTRLPNIGPVTAQKIIEARESRPFSSTWELQRIDGIGPGTAEALQDHAIFSDEEREEAEQRLQERNRARRETLEGQAQELLERRESGPSPDTTTPDSSWRDEFAPDEQ